MLIEILCTGDEILTGKTVNTNYSHMARRFGEVGLTMHWSTVVGDDRSCLATAFQQASQRADAVIVNGGLGPTVDDLSQEVAAEAAGVGLTLDENWLLRMLDFYERRGRTMPPNNKKQAMLPEGAEFIDFAVIDTGAGMSAEGVAKVFEEYTQAERSTSANHGGTGLGLPISKKFAEMMGGDVVLTSEEGVGSVFTLSVPRECPEYNEDDVDSKVINLDADDNLVVLVDDDVAMHDLIKRTISKLNLTLIGATNSEKGMELIREVKPKLILLDVLMPGRDGWSLLKECKTDSELKNIPVIMISQLNQSNLAASLGANDYLTKPIDRSHFVNTIQRLLGTGGKDQKVLVIDDDKDVRELLSRLLKDAGYRPIDARDGKEGLERTKDEPALIILDLEMPRMDGFEFLDNYIKDVPEDKRAPVLVFSGKDLTDVQEDLLKERVVGLVKKDDVSMDNLSKMIQGIVKK